MKVLLFVATIASLCFAAKALNVTQEADAAGWQTDEEWGKAPRHKAKPSTPTRKPMKNETKEEVLLQLFKATAAGINVVTEADFKKSKCEMPLPAGYYDTVKGFGAIPILEQAATALYKYIRPEADKSLLIENLKYFAIRADALSSINPLGESDNKYEGSDYCRMLAGTVLIKM